MQVGVFYYDYSDVSISTVRNEMDTIFNSMGVTYKNWDGADSQPGQTDHLNRAITAGSDLLIVNIVETSSPNTAQSICDAAKTAGIPVIFFNREVDNSVVNSYENCAFVGTNAPDAGHMQGKMIGQYLRDNALLIIMLLVAVYTVVSRPVFLSPGSIINLLSQAAAYLPVALGIGGCIVLTGTDLSAGRTVGITACVAASLLQAVEAANKMWPGIDTLLVPVVILIVVALGALIDAFNSFWGAKFKLHPFIVTLATQLIPLHSTLPCCCMCRWATTRVRPSPA